MKEKFGSVQMVLKMLENNLLFKNSGINTILVKRLMVYVSYITGNRIYEYDETGCKIRMIRE